MTGQEIIDPDGLEAYFTNVDYLRRYFSFSVTTPILQKRLLIIYGVGGVGKSSLLRIFRLNCKREKISVALASGDEDRSVLEVLTTWTTDLRTSGIKLPTLEKALRQFQSIQSKVDDKSRKIVADSNKAMDLAGKTAAKTIETLGGAAIGAAVGSVVPVIGTVVGALGGAIFGTSVEALMDWLGGFLTKQEINFLLDPSKRLTEIFLSDLTKVAASRRVILMLDTYEQLNSLDAWVCQLAKRLSANVLLVVAGREMVDWDRDWPGWLAQAEVQTLIPLTDTDIRELIHRYYATQIGGVLDSSQVDKIVRFSHGLPMAVTTAVRLWVKYKVHDFEEVESEALVDLVRRIREGVPPEVIPLLETTAVLRYFNKEILRDVTGRSDIDAHYEEIKRFPFVKSAKVGDQRVWRLHDSIREFFERSLQGDDPALFHKLHEKAVSYYNGMMTNAPQDKQERFLLEKLYHSVRVNEQDGMRLFTTVVGELVHFRLVDRLKVLLNDAGTYPLEYENTKMWRGYFIARLAQLEGRLSDAEEVYAKINKSSSVEPKLIAYALCDWGEILVRYERLGQPNGIEQATSILQRSLSLIPPDFHTVKSYLFLARVSRYKGNWDNHISYVEQVKDFSEKNLDKYGLLYANFDLMRAYRRRGSWGKLLLAYEESSNIAQNFPDSSLMKNTVLGEWGWALCMMGRMAINEQNLRKVVGLLRNDDDPNLLIHSLMSLGFVTGNQNKFQDSEFSFSESIRMARKFGSNYLIEEGSTLGFWGSILTRMGDFKRAESYLIKSIQIKEQLNDSPGLIEPLTWLGRLYETLRDYKNAQLYYARCIEWQWFGRDNFNVEAMIGKVRSQLAQGDTADITTQLFEAEGLCSQLEYNDHLAVLHLLKGNVAWDTKILGRTSGFDFAFQYYQRALIFALRHNRFCLDEVLWEGGVRTTFASIISTCLMHGEEGQQMLQALESWWQISNNDIDKSIRNTISTIPEGISLLEAERIARQKEPGDRSPQVTVLNKIGEALAASQ
jgi:tetratricopeptide (TPR) repeat protein